MTAISAEDRAKRLLQDTPRILADPLLAHGGRILSIVDPVAYGREACLAEIRAYGMIAFPMTARGMIADAIAPLQIDGTELLTRETFRNKAENVLPACEQVIAETPLPPNWRIVSSTAPAPDRIRAIQNLNEATGVSPQPAGYIAGDIVPVLSTMILDADETLVACAQASQRFHPESRLAGSTFNGLVSVAAEHRRQGLGALVTAALLRDSHKAWGWRETSANAQADNSASRNMLMRCGLEYDPEHLMLVVSLGGYVTR